MCSRVCDRSVRPSSDTTMQEKMQTPVRVVACSFFLVELNDLATLKHTLGVLLLFPEVVFQKF